MNEEIKKLQKLSNIFTVVGIITTAFALALCIAALADTIADSYRKDASQKAVIDSLQQEILLRDILIKQSKDTTYGEEKTK